jgi:hypothetical protein
MQGLLGVHNLDFYDPSSFKILLSEIDFEYAFSDGFYMDILNVGLLYPPFSMLLFAPLASLDLQTSRILMAILISLFILINSVLANFVFAGKGRSFYSLLFIYIVIMLLPGSNSTIDYSQTNFFLLLFLILVYNNIEKPSSGIFLALSTIIKPISGILLLFFLFKKKWKALIWFLGTVSVLLVITGLLWGFHNITEYFTSPPTQRLPQYLYGQDHNQSLIAIINRNLGTLDIGQSIINICYYLGAGLLLILTLFASSRLSKINVHISLLPFILLMLLIYPSSLIYYMVYLVPVLLYFLFLKNGEKYFWIILLPALEFTRIEVFFTYLIMWICLLVLSFFIRNNDSYEKLDLDQNDRNIFYNV